jgi:hypothetical protein
VPLPERLTVHLDAGYDYQGCRDVLAVAIPGGHPSSTTGQPQMS